MYDTFNLCLYAEECPDIDLLAEIPCHLPAPVYDQHKNKYTGYLGNLFVSITERSLFVSDSIAKYYKGNNVQPLTIEETRLALQKLADELHAPIEKAMVRRFDVGTCIELPHPPQVYLSRFGRARGNIKPNNNFGNLTYIHGDNVFTLYDKVRELKKGNDKDLAKTYAGHNLLRIEHRHKKPARKLRASALYDKDFWNESLKAFYDEYIRIEQRPMDNKATKAEWTQKAFAQIGIRASFENIEAALKVIDAHQRKGELTASQAQHARKLATSLFAGPISDANTIDEMEYLNAQVEAFVSDFTQ